MALPDGSYSVRSEVHKETFHPQVGAQVEARCVYFRPMRLRERLLGAKKGLCVWDIGLGGAGNALNLIRDHRDVDAKLHLHSFEVCLKSLEFALEHADKLDYLCGFQSFLSQLLRQHQIHFTVGKLEVSWSLHLGDLREGYGSVSDAEQSADAIMYDPYSPVKNPELWSLPAFERLYQRLKGVATLATYSRSSSIRVALLLAGFFVGRGGEVGEKEETTVAATTLESIDSPLDAAWLNKIRNSTNGEPIRSVPHARSFIQPSTWQQLLQHPQFATLSHHLQLPVRQ